MKNVLSKEMIRGALFILLFSVIGSGCEWTFNEQETMLKAKSYQAAREHSAAIIELKKVIKKNSSNKMARIMLAKSYIATGQGASAEKELNFSRKLGAPISELVGLLGQSLLLQKEYKRIINELPLSLAETPSTKASLMLTHGYAYLSMNNKSNAEALFLKVKNSNYLSAEADIALSQLALYDKKVDKALSYILDAIKEDNKNIRAWLLKGRIMLFKQDIKSAEASFENVITLSSDNGFKAEEFQAWVFMVQIALLQKDLDLAKSRVESLNKTAPRHPASKYYSALVNFQQKNYDKALTLLEEALLVVPNDLNSKLLLGATHYAKGNYEQAYKYLSYFVENVPTHIYARKMLAAVQIKLGQGTEALQSLKSGVVANNQDTELLTMIGQTALYNNRPDEAIDYLTQAKKSKPENDALRTELAKAYMRKGSYDEAILELSSIKGKGALQAKIMLVYAHIKKQDIKAAKSTVSQILKEAPELPESNVVAGIVELASGDRNQAKKYFSKAINIKNDYIPAILALARIEFESGETAQAETLYENVLRIDSKNEKAIVGLAVIDGQAGRIDKSILRLEQAISNSPKSLAPSIILGRYYLKKKEPDKALGIITAVANYHKNNPDIQSMLAQTQLLAGKQQIALDTAESIVKKWPKLATGYIELARVQVALKKFDAAKESLGIVLKLKPNQLAAKIALFSIYMQTGKFQKAINTAKEIKQKHPKLPVGNILTGDVYMANKEYQLAQKEYLAAFKIQQGSELLGKLSLAYQRGGKDGKAVKLLQGWIKDYPDDINIRRQLAILYSRLKDNKNAIFHYRRVLEKNPNDVAALNNVALLTMDKEPRTSLDYAEKAYELQPKIAEIGDTYGWILYKNGQIDKAKSILSTSALQSRHPSIQYHYAVVLAKKGENAKAVEILRKLDTVKFDESSDAGALLKRLEKN